MLWLTLNEALEIIRGVQNCTPIEAQRQLKVQIGDEIIPVKWADSEGVNDVPNPRYLRGTKLRVNLEGSTFVVLDSTPGLAYDDFSETYRPLRVLREAVLEAWPDATCTVKHRLQKGPESQQPVDARIKNENDQLQWMTLVEAEEHIEVLQKCDSVKALQQLKEEIGDGIVAVKWEDDPTDNPDVKILKNSEFILTGPGFAPCGKDRRQLLVNRADILRLWPETSGSIRETPAEPSNKQSGVGRRSERDQIFETLYKMNDDGFPLHGSQPRIAEEVAKRNEHKIGDKGWSERTLVQHISDWLKIVSANSKMRK